MTEAPSVDSTTSRARSGTSARPTAAYHIDALNGINVDAGIFMSYVGLFSYDNYENWMYLPSYTSDNTPWFFNGIRVQIFTSDKLKIEPWIINGWQTYGKLQRDARIRRADPLLAVRVHELHLERLRRLGHPGQPGAHALPQRQQLPPPLLPGQDDAPLHEGCVLGHGRHRRRDRRRRDAVRRQRHRGALHE